MNVKLGNNMTIKEFEKVLNENCNYVKTNNFQEIIKHCKNYEPFDLIVLQKEKSFIFLCKNMQGGFSHIVTNLLGFEYAKHLSFVKNNDVKNLEEYFISNGYSITEFENLDDKLKLVFRKNILKELNFVDADLCLDKNFYCAYLLKRCKGNMILLSSLDGESISNYRIIGYVDNKLKLIFDKAKNNKLSTKQKINIDEWEEKLHEKYNFEKITDVEQVISMFSPQNDCKYSTRIIKKDKDVIFLCTTTGEILNFAITNRINEIVYDPIAQYIETYPHTPIYIDKLLQIAKSQGYNEIAFDELNGDDKELYKARTRCSLSNCLQNEFVDERTFYAAYILQSKIKNKKIDNKTILFVFSRDKLFIDQYEFLNHNNMSDSEYKRLTKDIFGVS